jgi:ribosomal protein S18 acetylase RimI-like enzyme
MKIRKGEMCDFKELFKIMNHVPELKHIRRGKNYNKEWVKDMICNRRRYICLVAVENGKICGFLTAEFWKEGKYSFILDVYVYPEYREKGLGSALMNEHLKICKKAGLDFILTSALVSNKKMQKFLSKRKYKRGTEVYYFERKI